MRSSARLPLRLAPLLLLLLLCATLPHPASDRTAEALLWPLSIQEGCTSIFGESRSNHLHGGLDFRTHREEGWPCVAPADGAVERIRREPSGYGRVLYLRLDDGRTVVYGHLCRFEGGALGLEERLQAECAKAGTSFPGDITFDPPVRVNAGQTVAYSGEMGIGVPHLHLEVRRGDVQLDPFLEGIPLPADLGPPVLIGLTFVPRDASSAVDGSFVPLRVKARRREDGTYGLERPVALLGSVDVALAAHDRFAGDQTPCGFNLAEASLDGTPFFGMDLSRFTLKETYQGPALWRADLGWGSTEGLLLRRDGAVTLAGIAGEGLPAFGEGDISKELRVVASNRDGHRAVLTAILASGPAPPEAASVLPGRGFTLADHELLPAGLLLHLKRKWREGGTSLSAGAEPLRGFLVEEVAPDRVRVLIPADSLPRSGAELRAGGEGLGIFVAAGPSALSCGGLRLGVPAGAFATGTPGEHPLSASFRMGPPGPRREATVRFPAGAKPRGSWARGPWGRFLGAPGSGEVAFRGDGDYALRVDGTAPGWGKPFRATVPNLGAPEIRVPLKDSGSGLDLSTLRVRMDGKPVYPDWDVDAGLLRLDASAIGPGEHSLEGSVSDRVGNRATLPRRTFRIPPRP